MVQLKASLKPELNLKTIMLYGPEGGGKTMMVETIASEVGVLVLAAGQSRRMPIMKASRLCGEAHSIGPPHASCGRTCLKSQLLTHCMVLFAVVARQDECEEDSMVFVRTAYL